MNRIELMYYKPSLHTLQTKPQSIIFDKRKYETLQDVVNWCKCHGYHYDKIEERYCVFEATQIPKQQLVKKDYYFMTKHIDQYVCINVAFK